MNRRKRDEVDEALSANLDDAFNERMEEMSSRNEIVCDDAFRIGDSRLQHKYVRDGWR